MAKICKFTVEIEMALEGDSTPTQAENSIIEWIDRMMLYQIGYNEVADTKRPYVFDYDVFRSARKKESDKNEAMLEL